ncbi:hypothetical protein [Klebsiella phage GZ8]|uniref:Uncharacterized protein n=1 Tax=Klebsiella phage GZ8 TaxID=2972533 RepID=A0A976SWB0_9CAUD|nr:hypothetical protein [Klebsiella phage GZ8]
MNCIFYPIKKESRSSPLVGSIAKLSSVSTSNYAVLEETHQVQTLSNVVRIALTLSLTLFLNGDCTLTRNDEVVTVNNYTELSTCSFSWEEFRNQYRQTVDATNLTLQFDSGGSGNLCNVLELFIFDQIVVSIHRNNQSQFVQV